MTTLQIQVSDKILQSYGRAALTKQINRFVALEAMRISALEIEQAVSDAGLNND